MSFSKESPVTYFYSPRACTFVGYTAILHPDITATLVLAKVGDMTDEFLKINPKGRIPVIVVGNEVITEMAAVLTAIASMAPDSKLLGSNVQETIRVYEWLNYLSTVAHNQAMAQIWRTERFTNDMSTYPAIKAKGTEVIQEVYSVIEKKLSARNGREYAVGNSFTVADPFIVVVYLWSGKLGFDMEKRFPVFSAYAKRHLSKHAFKMAAEVHSLL